MTIISLLVVLLVERVTTKSQYWQFEFYFNKYINSTRRLQAEEPSSRSWWWLAIIALPVLVVYVLVQKLSNGLLELVLSTAILMVCVGCPAVRATYKCFLQAANRGDIEACSLYADQIGEPDETLESFGRNLVWQNYLHYASVILWFTALGASGALLYVLARETYKHLKTAQHPSAADVRVLMHILDWVPVRITALGFLLVGHFSRAFPTWLGHLLDPQIAAKTLLINVATQAEEVEPDENNCAEEPCTLVRLAKRNVMFILVAIALLTLSGWIN